MRAGQRGSSWQSFGVTALALALSAGCAADNPRLANALRADHTAASHGADREGRYVVHCPDVLEVRTEGQPGDAGPQRVGADGRVALADGGRLRVDGLTTDEIAAAAARRLGLPPARVGVEVVGYNSQQIYLFGEVAGLQRAAPYRGPETVLDLLERVGGVGPGAAAGDVQVLRSHVADGSSPELFQVDLEAILLKHDQSTNVRLEPFDQVYVGQSRRSSLKPCFPPWLQPLYERLSGIRPRPDAAPQGPPSGRSRPFPKPFVDCTSSDTPLQKKGKD